MKVLPAGRRAEILRFELRAVSAPTARAAAKHPAQKVLEARTATGASAPSTRPPKSIGTKTETFEMRATGAMRATARSRTEPFETLEARLAFRVDLAAVKRLALVAVADDLVGGIQLGKARRCLWVVLVGVGVQLLREPPIGALDVGLVRTLGNPQHLVGVAHRVQTPVKSPVPLNTSDSALLMWGSKAADATRRRPLDKRLGLLPGLEGANFPDALLLLAGFALNPRL